MEGLTLTCVTEGEDALLDVPASVERMERVLGSKFAYTSLKDIESRFKNLLSSPVESSLENKEMSELMSTVRDETTQALNILLALKRWIRVQVPKIEDGNNFGVSVQLDVAKGIEELSASVAKGLDELPGYHASRASAWGKISKTTTKESKVSTSSEKETGGKDGDTSKASESSSTEEKTAESSAAPDSSLHLVALDVNWFVTLHHLMLRARDAVVVAGDMIEKNKEKLLRPKGTNTRGGGMYSF